MLEFGNVDLMMFDNFVVWLVVDGLWIYEVMYEG